MITTTTAQVQKTTMTQAATVASTLTGEQAEVNSAFVQNFDRSREFESDVLVQLKANLAQLEDLHNRLKFAMSEISYLIKRS